MSTLYTRAAGPAPTAGPRVAPSAEDSALWAHLYPYAADKAAVWIDPALPSCYAGLRASSAASAARVLDRAGNRVLTPEPVRLRHPIAVDVDSRPVFLFGAGGATPNNLDNNYNGALTTAAGTDARGEGDNAAPFFLPGVGLSVAAKLRIPPPNGSIGTVTFGSAPGGAILGGATSANDDDALVVGVSFQTGYVVAATRQSAGSSAVGSQDLRDNAWHDYVWVMDAANGTIRIWVDGTLAANSTLSVDVATSAGSAKIMLGAVGRANGGPGNRFGGLLAGLVAVAAPLFGGADARAAARAWLATR